MKKKVLSVLLVGALAVSMGAMAGCGSSDSSSSDSEESADEEAEATDEEEDADAGESEVDEEDAEEAEEVSEEAEAEAQVENTSGATEVSLWHYFDDEGAPEAFQELCDEYNASQDEIYVVPTYVSREELMNQYTIGAISGELPDIGMVDNPDMESYISLGVFEDITDQLESWGELDHFYESNLVTCKDPDGNLYGLPQNTNCLCLAVNTDLFDAAGLELPTSIDEFEEDAIALTDPSDSTYGFAMSAIATEEGTFQLLPWLVSNYNGESVNIDDLTADSAVHGLQVLGNLASEGALSTECVSWTQADAWNQFCAGKAAMSMMGTWQLNQADSIDFNWDVILLPSGDEGTTTSCIGGENFGVCSGATNVDACVDFLEWLMSVDIQERWANMDGKLCTRDDANPVYEYAQEGFETFQEALSYATARGPHAQWPTISEAIYTAGQKVIANGEDASSALATAMETITPILEETPLPQ